MDVSPEEIDLKGLERVHTGDFGEYNQPVRSDKSFACYLNAFLAVYCEEDVAGISVLAVERPLGLSVPDYENSRGWHGGRRAQEKGNWETERAGGESSGLGD